MVTALADASVAGLDSEEDCDAEEDRGADDDSCAMHCDATNVNARASRTLVHVSAVDLEATMAETD
jgi:hypothetical protein